MIANVKRIESAVDVVVLEGWIDNHPQLTKRVTIMSASLADGSVVLADVVAALKAEVLQNHANWMAVQAALLEL